MQLGDLIVAPTRHLFFTGKGGVGKTSLACATAVALADRGQARAARQHRSRLQPGRGAGRDAGPEPTAVPASPARGRSTSTPKRRRAPTVSASSGPYRGRLPDAAVASIEEQLSGACTVEIAAFDEFAKLLATSRRPRLRPVLFDTAPTGHTLRLLSLPAAWSGFIEANPGPDVVPGPAGRSAGATRASMRPRVRALSDAALTTLVLVTRPEKAALREAERTGGELAALGVSNQRLIVNGVFTAADRDDRLARALEARGARRAPAPADALAKLERITVPLSPHGIVGVAALRELTKAPGRRHGAGGRSVEAGSLPALVDALEAPGRGVIMTMGKGGVGKTTIAAAIAQRAGAARSPRSSDDHRSGRARRRRGRPPQSPTCASAASIPPPRPPPTSRRSVR